MMKMLKILLIALFLQITTGCGSLPRTEAILPPKPERQEQKSPENLKDYADLILYYETLVQKWEQWADTVEKLK